MYPLFFAKDASKVVFDVVFDLVLSTVNYD